MFGNGRKIRVNTFTQFAYAFLTGGKLFSHPQPGGMAKGLEYTRLGFDKGLFSFSHYAPRFFFCIFGKTTKRQSQE
jgi:hypothetical protein